MIYQCPNQTQLTENSIWQVAPFLRLRLEQQATFNGH
jgi:hypothetical protein